MVDFLSDLASVVLAKGMDASGMKHRAIADNIANIETPGYKRKDISFAEQLQDALSTPNSNAAMKRVEETDPGYTVDTTSPGNASGNNVRIDSEMADLTKNTLQYEALIRLNNMKGSMLITAITEGRR